MKIAICYNRFDIMGGAERVVIKIAKLFNADIFTLIYRPKEIYKEVQGFKITDLKIFDLPKQRIFYPWIYSIFNGLGILKFRLLDLSGYDLVITCGRLAFFAKGKKTIHVCINMATFDFQEHLLNYLGESYGAHVKFIANVWWEIKKLLEKWAAKRIDIIIAISKHLQSKIKRHYNKESIVVYPSVNIKKFKFCKSKDYFLSVQRLSPEKRVELQIEIFKKLPKEKLIMVGGYKEIEYKNKIEKIIRKSKNIERVGSVSEEKLIDLYSHSKAVIQTGIDEPFGIVPIEAMASGKPVLAVDEGGFRETILNGETGILIKKPYVENFIKAIKNFNSYKFNPEVCMKRTKLFSEEIFIKKMKEVIKKVISNS
ncbi:glycosyltransferase [Patescibacteria group bacterium]|nr:glycosyltransferase [Patescibacteria group bacterium]